jgi:hypothetical protein
MLAEQEAALLAPVQDPKGLVWLHISNRGEPEYETAASEPASSVPIVGKLTITQYAVTIQRRDRENLAVHNRLAKVTGSLGYFSADESSLKMHKLESPLASGSEVMIPEHIAAWMVVFKGTKSVRGTIYATRCQAVTNVKSSQVVRYMTGK